MTGMSNCQIQIGFVIKSGSLPIQDHQKTYVNTFRALEYYSWACPPYLWILKAQSSDQAAAKRQSLIIDEMQMKR